MEFAPGAIQLDDIIGGTLQAGEIPNARLEAELTILANALDGGGRVPNAQLRPDLKDLADALTAGGKVPHANLTGELVTLANALTAGGKVPNANLTGALITFANALISGGRVPFPYITRSTASGKNGAQKTITAGGVTVIAKTLTALEVGDRILVYTMFEGQKGGAQGDTRFQLRQNGGTGTILFVDDGTVSQNSHSQLPANKWWYGAWSSIAEVTVEGTAVVELYGVSVGADFIIAADKGQLLAWVLPGV